MHLELFKRHILKSKGYTYTVFLAIFLVFLTPSLEAAHWGQTKKVVDYEGTLWNKVYFVVNGLDFTLSMPNYYASTLQNGIVSLHGEAEKGVNYSISTYFCGGYTFSASLEGFVKSTQNEFPETIVVAIESETYGAKFVVDVIPKNPEDSNFRRILCTGDNSIVMLTNDNNEKRRNEFFESIFID